MLLNKKKQKGFTLIELMTVIVILGILVTIGLNNFSSAQDRAKLASTKANMKVLQTMLETYGVDYGAIYPTSQANLKTEATLRGYWKQFDNPFDQSALAISDIGTISVSNQTGVIKGTVYYEAIGTNNISKYYIYGGSKDDNILLTERNIIFFVTNN